MSHHGASSPNFFYRNLKRQYPTIRSATGVWVTDTEGKSYLDGCSGAIVSNLGHSVREIDEAIKEQLGRVAFAHTSQFVSESAVALAEKLVRLTPEPFANGARAYFTSGGSESIETALKMARSYVLEAGQGQRTISISRWQSYHGSTMGALSLTGHPARRKPYIPLLKDQPHITAAYPYRCRCGSSPPACYSAACALSQADELEAAILEAGPENVMTFVAEPIVGAALGAVVPGPGYWQRIREICTRYGVMLVADEVMTGLGRTGTNFGLDLWNVQPDIIALGKGLAAGYLPLGAVVASGPVAKAIYEGSGIFEHGFTYSGHPVACAAGLAAVTYLTEHHLVSKVADGERRFFNRLEELRSSPLVGDVRGRGYLAGIELVGDRSTGEPISSEVRISQVVTRAAARRGLLVYPGSGSVDGVNGDHLMVAPPFTIDEPEMDELFTRLDGALKDAYAEVKEQVRPVSESTAGVLPER